MIYFIEIGIDVCSFTMLHLYKFGQTTYTKNNFNNRTKNKYNNYSNLIWVKANYNRMW